MKRSQENIPHEERPFDPKILEEQHRIVARIHDETLDKSERKKLFHEFLQEGNLFALEQGLRQDPESANMAVSIFDMLLWNSRGLSVDEPTAVFKSIAKNTDALEKLFIENIKNENSYENARVFNLITQSARLSRDPDDSDLGEYTLSRMVNMLEENKTNISLRQYSEGLNFLMNSGFRETEEQVMDLLKRSILHDAGDGVPIHWENLAWCLTNESRAVRDLGIEAAQEYLSSLHIENPQKYLNAWVVGSEKNRLGEDILNNMRTIERLEKAYPGTVNTLHREFGIFDFGRYPVDVLMRQYEERDNNESPYGVIFYPRNDYNGAFYQSREVFRDLFKQLDGKFELRVCEGDGKLDIVKLLHRLNKKYGAKHKISFTIIGGHGTRGSIKFGGNDEQHTLKITDLCDERHSTQDKAQYFEDHPTFILISCSTGSKYGIAEQLSERMNATVIAPNVDTNIKSIRAEIDDEIIMFDVEYHKKSAAKAYTAGVASGENVKP